MVRGDYYNAILSRIGVNIESGIIFATMSRRATSPYLPGWGTQVQRSQLIAAIMGKEKNIYDKLWRPRTYRANGEEYILFWYVGRKGKSRFWKARPWIRGLCHENHVDRSWVIRQLMSRKIFAGEVSRSEGMDANMMEKVIAVRRQFLWRNIIWAQFGKHFAGYGEKWT